MFATVLIANRGEIAVRIARTCRELGVRSVAVYSDADRGARHVDVADEAVHLPGVAASDTYLNVPAILEAARATGAEAVHPGYGFFSERADAAEAVLGAGLAWVGPPVEAARALGDKVRARRLATEAGVPVVPGTLEPVRGVEDVRGFGEEHGYPVAIKAAGGGGGRGMRIARSPDEAGDALEAAVREAGAAFGRSDVYLERYLDRPKHIEIQALSPGPGRTLWLGARDCSLQRRHQKLVEETPPPLHASIVPEMGRAAVAVMNAAGYVNAGTVEFLVDEGGRFYFLEVNARLQVEHTITEEVLGIDLVAAQLAIAAGDGVDLVQDDVTPRGHAIECRINAEDPARGFVPVPGRIGAYVEPAGIGIRVDSGYGPGTDVPSAYDSLVAKVIAWGPGREEARRRMLRALDEFVIDGIATTIPAHRLLLGSEAFVDATYSTRTIDDGALAALEASPGSEPGGALLVGGRPAKLWHPAMASFVAGSGGRGAVAGSVVAPMHGTVLRVLAAPGDDVRAGDTVAVLEAMKMETPVGAPTDGTVDSVHVKEGDVVEAGESIAEVAT